MYFLCYFLFYHFANNFVIEVSASFEHILQDAFAVGAVVSGP